MARPKSPNPPAYRPHKASGQAIVTIDGRDHYLGAHGSKESQDRYDELIAQWLAGGRRLAAPLEQDKGPGPGITLTELLAAYWEHTREYYAGSGELNNLKDVMDLLERRFGPLPVVDFGPLALTDLRQAWIDGTYRPPRDGRRPPKPLCRKVINARVNRVRRVFRWGVARQLIPAFTLQALQTLEPLKAGRSKAVELPPVRPVAVEVVNQTLPFLSWPVADMVRLQLLTGMRSGELVIMRTGDIDTSGRVWRYSPARHKTMHHGHARTVWIGPKAQKVLRPYLKADLQAYLFSPKEALEARSAKRRAERRTPMTPSQRARRRKVRPRKHPGSHFTTQSYGRVIAAACRKAGIAAWFPHMLRHTAATQIRAEFGVELSRIILGHASLRATEVYAEADLRLAADAMAKVG